MIAITKLNDEQLSWAFAAAIGLEVYLPEDLKAMGAKAVKSLDAQYPVIKVKPNGELVRSYMGREVSWLPCKKWEQTSVIWNMANVSISKLDTAALNRKTVNCVGNGPFESRVNGATVRAANPLVALCRATVLNKFGGSIDVLDQLK